MKAASTEAAALSRSGLYVLLARALAFPQPEFHRETVSGRLHQRWQWDNVVWGTHCVVKWLHLAGDYGHFRFRPLCWQPVPIDRAVRLELEAAG